MNNFTRIFTLTLLLLALSFVAGATTISFNTLPSINDNGTYNGFVGATVDGINTQQLICDDFLSTTYIPSGPTSFILTTFTGPGTPMGGTKFNSEKEYDEAAYLLFGDGTSNLPGLININPTDGQLVTSYQYALWNIFTPAKDIESKVKNALPYTSSALLTYVTDINKQFNFSDTGYVLDIYTPCGAGPIKNFLDFRTTLIQRPNPCPCS